MSIKSARGFTLMETVLAMAILSVVIVALASMFRSAFMGFGRTDQMAKLDVESEMVNEHFSRDLRNVVRFSPLQFQGCKDSLSFVALIPTVTRNGNSTICHAAITYRYITGEKQCLTRICSPFCGSAVDSTVLIDVADSLVFSYGYLDENGLLVWNEVWNPGERNKMPLAVRMEFIHSQGSGERKLSQEFRRTVYVRIDSPAENDVDENNE